MEERACDVLIVGCGPTGVVLANLLGALGVRVEVLERDAAVFPVCRATHIDEETLRNFQATGLFSSLLPHTAPFGQVDVVDGGGEVLLTESVRERENVHGRDGSRFFDQPAFERVLRAGLARFPSGHAAPRGHGRRGEGARRRRHGDRELWRRSAAMARGVGGGM